MTIERTLSIIKPDAVAFCFAVLLVHARPFVGQMAIRPTELQSVFVRAQATP